MIEVMIVVGSIVIFLGLIFAIKEMVIADFTAQIESVVETANKALGEVRGEIKELKNEINKRG